MSTTKHPLPYKATTGERLLRLPEVEAKTGFRRSWIYKMVHDGAFPRAVATGQRARAWRLSDVERWIAERPVSQPHAA